MFWFIDKDNTLFQLSYNSFDDFCETYNASGTDMGCRGVCDHFNR